jgi:hypothetical protein
LQELLARSVTTLLAPGAYVLLQSSVQTVATAMVDIFQGSTDSAKQYEVGHGVALWTSKTSQDRAVHPYWLDENPFEACSETEAATIITGRPCYRVLMQKWYK